jgi:hypothetical protein
MSANQARFDMGAAALQKIYDDDLRKLTLERFKAGQTIIFWDTATRHLLGIAGECLSLCGDKRFPKFSTVRKIKSYNRAGLEALLPQLDGREICEKCLNVIREALQ